MVSSKFEVEAQSWFLASGELKGMGFKLVRGSIVLYLDGEPHLFLGTSLGRVSRVIIYDHAL